MSVQETPPSVVATADWRFPAVTDSRLDNGMRVLVYHCPGQYVVSASLLFDVPLDAEPRPLEGVAGLSGRCLPRGSAGRSADEFADAVALCGADIDASAFADGFAVRLTTPVSTLSRALGLVADAVSDPNLDADEFDHEKRLRLQEIEQAQAYPQHVAAEQLNAALFGVARAGRPVGGAADTVEQVQREDVVAFAADHLQPSAATLILAGDFGTTDPLALTSDSFGSWDHVGSDMVDATRRPVISDLPQVGFVDWPDAPQSTIRVGGQGIDRADPRWPALFVANFAVGGNFSSRINTVLREEKGVTYGANSSLDTSRGTGLLTVSTAVRANATAESVADIVSILSGAAGTLTDDEVQMGVRAATDSAAVGFERAEAVVNRVEMIVSQRLPLNYVDTNLAGLRAVTTAAANEAYLDVVDPDRLTIVVVGSGPEVREPLAAWGYAEVRDISPLR